MLTLLVQSCSKSKNPACSPGPAFDIYDGYYFKIIKKAIDEGNFVTDLDICILSAKYGLLDPNDEIDVYDRRMDTSRASELRPEVTEHLKNRVRDKGYEQVVLNVGKDYRAALDEDSIPVPVYEVPGDGLGEKGHQLKRFIRGESAVVTEER